MPDVNLEFLNKNSIINFPIREDADRTSKNGELILPNYLLVDFILVVPETLVDRQVFVRKFSLFANLLSLELADDLGNAVSVVAVDTSTHTPFQDYSVQGVGNYISARGKIVLGDLSALADIPNGYYEFNFESTVFEITCLRPDVRGVNGIVLINNDVEGAAIYGDIQIVAGTNFKITEISPGVIQLNAISGEGLNIVDPCKDAISLPPPIRTINGLAADESGNFGLEGSPCMEITGSEGLLKFLDKCSSACCGCDELTWLTDRMAILVQQNVDMQEALSGLATALADFKNNVLATTT